MKKEMFTVLCEEKQMKNPFVDKILTSKKKALKYVKEEVELYKLPESFITYFKEKNFITYETPNFKIKVALTEVV